MSVSAKSLVRLKQYNDELLIAGRCPSHPNSNIVPGKRKCTKCYGDNRARYYTRKKDGKCTKHQDRNAVSGVFCEECLNKKLQMPYHVKKLGTCAKCKGVVAIGHYCERCKEHRKRLHRAVVHTKHQLIEKLCSIGCIKCGYQKFIGALEFHHIDKEIKDGNIGSKTITFVKKEVLKCVLFCSNCHREFHAGLFAISKEDIDKCLNHSREVLDKW